MCVACGSGDTSRDPRSPGGTGGTDTSSAGTGGTAGDFGNGPAPTGAGSGGTTTATGGGGAAAAGGGGSSAGTGSFAVGDMNLDPSATFEWKETLPGQGNCEPGRYAGTFTCDYVAMGGDPNAPLTVVTGPVTMTLEKSQDGEFLDISDGKLEGIAQLIFGFRSDLEGRLDCTNDTFEAMAINGIYGFGDPAIFPGGTFEGTLSGTLDRSTVTLTGDWAMTVTGNAGNCDGPWEITWTP